MTHATLRTQCFVLLLGASVLCSQGSVHAQPTTNAAPPPIRLERIAPGMTTDAAANAGWSHLVLVSQPAMAPDQRAKVSQYTVDVATRFFTVNTARVQRNPATQQFQLTALGFGLGTYLNGRQVVISPESQAQLGANLDWIERFVLNHLQGKLNEIRLVAAWGQGVIIDTPIVMPLGSRHVAATIRYAHHVEPATGQLTSYVWRLDHGAPAETLQLHGDVHWLQPGLTCPAALQVDLAEYHLGFPTEVAFAVTHIPPTVRTIPVPPEGASLFAQPRYTLAEAQRMEAFLLSQARTGPP